MNDTLQSLAADIKNHELEDLFPESEPEKVREDEEKVREAVFQVYGIVWNEELYRYCQEHPEITKPKLKELCRDREELERVNKAMGAVTVTENEDGETVIPSTDVKYALTKKPGLWD